MSLASWWRRRSAPWKNPPPPVDRPKPPPAPAARAAQDWQVAVRSLEAAAAAGQAAAALLDTRRDMGVPVIDGKPDQLMEAVDALLIGAQAAAKFRGYAGGAS